MLAAYPVPSAYRRGDRVSIEKQAKRSGGTIVALSPVSVAAGHRRRFCLSEVTVLEQLEA